MAGRARFCALDAADHTPEDGDGDGALDPTLDGIRYLVTIVGGRLHIQQGGGGGALALDTDTATLRSLVFGGRRFTDAVAGGDAVLVGSREAVERFLGAFR